MKRTSQFAAIGSALLAAVNMANAQVPTKINFQGLIKADGGNFDGTGYFKFALVDDTGSATHWSNDGSSSAGGEPTTATPLAVEDGILSVNLGETSRGMLPISPATFDDRRNYLRIWFDEDGVPPFTQLTPDQQIVSVGYAMMAARVADGVVSADALEAGAITSTAIADSAVTSAKLAENSVTSRELADQVALGSPSTAGLLSVYGGDGLLGLPSINLDGDLGWVSSKNGFGVGTGSSDARLVSEPSGGSLRIYDEFAIETVRLGAKETGNGGVLNLYQGGGGLGIELDGTKDYSNEGGRIRVYQGGVSNNIGVTIFGDNTGGGGEITLRNPAETKTVQILAAETSTTGGEISLYRANGTRTVKIDGEAGSSAGGWVGLYNGGGTNVITLNANADEGKGRITTGVLEITGGADLSEQFNITPAAVEFEPGMVLCIDPENPGALRVSTKGYDPTVAGIMSGAGGVKPGMLMGQQGSVADGEHPVALAGRVFCFADASVAPIVPGDLLTTSALPGHAMKATDSTRSAGAIIGKAMSGLESGTGLVLVLVNLQ